MKYIIETNELNQALDMMISPMMLIGCTGNPAYVNHAFKKQIGYNIEQLPNMDAWVEIAYPDEHQRMKVLENWGDAMEFALKKGVGAAHVVSKIRCTDGVYRWFDVYRQPFENKETLTFLNIDEIKQQADELTDMVRQKDTLLAIVAHDVRSPLSCIKQIVSEYKALNLSEQDMKELFFRMNNQVDHVFNILNSLLIRTSIERSRFAIHHDPIDLKKFFSKYTDYYKDRLDNRNISLILDVPDGAVLNYDHGILDVVCRNLLDNAIKYSAKNGIISISFKKIANQAKLIIWDTGPGMPYEQVERIINNQGNRKPNQHITDGFGLGLSLAKEILEKHHGKLSVQSEMGIGTSFIIDITEHPFN